MKKMIATILAAAAVVSAAHAQTPAAKTLPKLLDLGATQCIPCKMMAPLLEELKKEYAGRMEVEFIDVWQKENAEKAKKYGIESIPTQIFFDPAGKELWRHTGFISKEDILAKWKELGFDFAQGAPAGAKVERWQPAAPDTRPKDAVCQLCDGDIDPKTRVSVRTDKGEVHLCSPHHLFVMLSCLQQDVEGTERSAKVADWAGGSMTPALSATYLVAAEEKTGRPEIKAFADRPAAEKERAASGGVCLAYPVLKQKEMEARCGFCDRSVYPQDASLVKVGTGLHTWGCCAHCALGIAARMGADIEVHQPDGLTGEMIVIKTINGSVASVEPPGAIAWFGQRKNAEGKAASAGCFHQGNFVTQANLKKWLDARPLETGCEITIAQALADKMKLSPQQIQKACKIGECAPK
jgi:thioredoxin 1